MKEINLKETGDISYLEVSERGNELGIRIIYKGKKYDGYLMECDF